MSSDLDALALTDDELAAFDNLSPSEQAAYIELLSQALGDEWELAPKQRYAEAIWGKVDWMLYGGSAGGGKSELAIKHASDLSERVPGHVSLIVRQSIPELRRSVILRLIARTKQFRIPARLRKIDGVTSFRYQNGSHIECGYLATDEHLGNYLSAEYDLILVDEASLMTDDQITQLSARLRTTRTKALLGARPHLGLFSNPGGRSHAWLYSLFVTATEYGNCVVVYDVSEGIEKAAIARVYRAPCTVRDATQAQFDEAGEPIPGTEGDVERLLIPWAENLDCKVDPRTELAVAFVPAKAVDNPHIDPGYMKYLNALPERRRRQLRDGDWDSFEGQYFAEYRRDLHVIPPFDIPDGWARARGADFGSAAPWSCHWGAWDNDGNCYIYKEAYRAGMTPIEQARQAKEMSTTVDSKGRVVRENYIATVADPSVFADKRGTGKSIADLWRDNGFHVTRAKNARVAGWQNMRQYLWDAETKKPRLYIFDSCTELIRTLPLMQHDKRNREDIDTTLEDHAADSVRYLLSVRPIGERLPPSRLGLTIDQRFSKMVGSRGKKAHKRLFN